MTRRADRLSIVIPAHNEGENLVDTVHCVLENSACPDFEIVVVDDASTDGSSERLSTLFGDDPRVSIVRAEGVGVANARNLGADRASGKILIFLDGHCYTPPDWIDGLIEPLEDKRVGMVGPAVATMSQGSEVRGLGMTWRNRSLEAEWLPQSENTAYPVPLLGGACQAVRKEDFEKLGNYDSGMTRFGSEDLEICLRYWLMGYEVLVQPRTVIYHLFRQTHPYQVHTQKIIYNRLRMAMLHLSEERISRVLDYHSSTPGFDEIMRWLKQSHVMDRRKQLMQQRCRDDDWFCKRFDCQI